MSTTKKIMTNFNAKIDLNKEYTRADMAKILTEVFKEVKEQEKAKQKLEQEKAKQKLEQEKAKQKPKKEKAKKAEKKPIVKIENLPIDVSELEVRNLLLKYEEDIQLIYILDGFSIGEQAIAFITFEKLETVRNVISELNGISFKGRILSVKM